MPVQCYINEALIPMMGLFVFVIGACIGSFLNVCIWRIPRDESIVSPGSHCPSCNRSLEWFENIPLLSWSFLRAKCRTCRAPINARYFAVELLTALLFSAVWTKVLTQVQPAAFLLPYFIVTALVILTAFIDAEHRIIPNEITYPVAVAGIVFAFIWPETQGVSKRSIAVAMSLISLVLAVGIMTLFSLGGKAFFRREALGWGDVKYCGAIAACLGVPAFVFTLLFGSLTGSIYGLAIVALKKRKMRSTIPFGPFLAAGSFVWILFGEKILETYFELSRLLALRVGQ